MPLRPLRFLLFSLCSLFLFHSGYAELSAYQLFDKKGKKVEFEKVLKSVEGKKFIFFGEYHDNPISHWMQFELMRELHAIYRKKLVLGGEMFEADNQYILNEYLNGQISTSNFQSEVRLWPNYNTDYKPLIEYAKKYTIPFIATNIPRRYANMVYKRGLTALDSVSETAKNYFIPTSEFVFDSTVTCYREMIRSMGEHGGVAIAQAQAIKDATMAYFILKNVTSKNVFLHFNGAYHSNNYEGILHYLLQKVEKEKVMTLSTVEQEDVSELKGENKGIADFILCVPQNMTKTH